MTALFHELGPGDSTGIREWDAFVEQSPSASLYHTSAWQQVIRDAFGKSTTALVARSAGGAVTGVLPLVRIRSLLFGDRLVSMPYSNYGGPVADTPTDVTALRSAAVEKAKQLNVPCLELRETVPGSQGFGTREDKVIMQLTLPAELDQIGKSIGAKRRSQIRRSFKEGASVQRGGRELIPEFYEVFSRNMRDLGTPVYPRRFFDVIGEQLAERMQIVVIRINTMPAAACLLLRWQGSMEIPWASSNREYNRFGVNMLLYWEAISYAIESRCRIFDFGRSSKNSGTFKFKKQWGAAPVQCHWHYWPASRAAEAMPRDEGSLSAAQRIWQRLPLPVANRVGPMFSENLPW